MRTWSQYLNENGFDSQFGASFTPPDTSAAVPQAAAPAIPNIKPKDWVKIEGGRGGSGQVIQALGGGNVAVQVGNRKLIYPMTSLEKIPMM